jgi:hypothetical protein
MVATCPCQIVLLLSSLFSWLQIGSVLVVMIALLSVVHNKKLRHSVESDEWTAATDNVRLVMPP